MARKKLEEESEHEESDEAQVSGDSNGSGSGSDSGSDSAEEELQEQVAGVPFEVLQQARSNGQATSFSRAKNQHETKRANKNRPMEMSSKKPVPRFREVIQAPKREARDPRFESLCGKFEESRFKKAYSFIYDEELPAERQRLKKELVKGGGDTEEARKRLEWIDKELREEQQRRKRAEAAAQHSSKEREAVKKGKKPFYPKKSEQKKEELVEKYQELKASGKLDKFMEKRRKKNSAKDHRFLPYRRPQV